jgi:Na+/melibiose symporter-like transporter
MIVGITLSKKFADKYGKRDVFRHLSFHLNTVRFRFHFLSATKRWINVRIANITWLFLWFTIPLLWAMIADVADYSEWKNNRRATAIIFSAMMVG